MLPVQPPRWLCAAAAALCGQVTATRRGARASGAPHTPCWLADTPGSQLRTAAPVVRPLLRPQVLIQLLAAVGHSSASLCPLEPPRLLHRRVWGVQVRARPVPSLPSPGALGSALSRSVLRRSLPRVNTSHCAGTGPSGAYSEPRHTLNHRWRCFCAQAMTCLMAQPLTHCRRGGLTSPCTSLTRHTTQGNSLSCWAGWPRAARCVTPAPH